MPLDWSQAAAVTAEQSSLPILITDAAGQIKAANRAAERVLGIGRRNLLERELSSVLGPLEAGPSESEHYFHELLVPPRQKKRCILANRVRPGQLLAVDIEPIGNDSTGGLVLSVHNVIAHPGRVTSDVDFEIEVGDTFGTLTCLSVMGRHYEAEYFGGRRCYELLRHKAHPCAECPARQVREDGAEVVMVGCDSTDDDAFVAVSARKTGTPRVHVSERHLTGQVVRQALSALIATIGRNARLSSREAQVLDGLARGHSFEKIAEQLEISPRTVKFHQSNVLQKLGIASRQDLLRLLIERQLPTR